MSEINIVYYFSLITIQKKDVEETVKMDQVSVIILLFSYFEHKNRCYAEWKPQLFTYIA